MSDVEPRSPIIKKLAEVMGELHRLPKSGHNAFHNYDYVTETDVAEAVRGLLSAKGILLSPDVIEHKREKKPEGKGWITDIMVKWTFTDSESGTSLILNMPGCAEDSGDKGLWKAITGSAKYVLLKTFLIGSGEDPEKDDTPSAWQQKEPPQGPLPTRPQQLQTPPAGQSMAPVMPRYEGPPKTAPVNGGQVWQGQLMAVEAKAITSKKTGQPYVIHEFKIALQDGVATAGAGFNEELVDKGKLAVGRIIRAQIVAGQKRGFWNIESFEVVS